MNNQLIRVKTFVQTNKRALVVAAITVPLLIIQHKGIKNLNNFLKDQNLFDTFYTKESFDTLTI